MRREALIALLVLGCSAEPPAPEPPPELPDWIHAYGPDMAFDPDPEMLGRTEAALDRWNAAAGLGLHIARGGLPVKAADEVRDDDGEPVCGGTVQAFQYDAHVGVVEIKVSRACGDSMDRVTVHEAMHAMCPGCEHTDTGIYAAGTWSEPVINEDVLTRLCSAIECGAFVPEN